MLNYSEFIVGFWFVPVILCILIPLAMLCLWSIKRILDDISASVKRVEGAVVDSKDESKGSLRPHPAS